MSSTETSFSGTGIPLSLSTVTEDNSLNNNNSNYNNNNINNNNNITTPAAPTAENSQSNYINNTESMSMSSTAGTSFNSNTSNNSKNNDPINDDTSKKDNGEDKKDESIYECNICLDTAKDAVVSMCGHLFCWPCLHQWLETRPTRKLCPVCKAAISKEKVIPLYGRNSTKQEDPRTKVPPRPAGQRTEPDPSPGFQGFGFGDGGFHMSFGIGAFPFGYFASSFNFGEPRTTANQRATTQYDDEQFLSKIFLYLAVIFMGWLLFA